MQIGRPAAAETLRLRAVTNAVEHSNSNGAVADTAPHSTAHDANNSGAAESSAELRAIESGVAAGFQMAAAAGPLCADPLWGVAFELEVAVEAASETQSNSKDGSSGWRGRLERLDARESVYGPLSGQV